ncbi:MAG TPA: hypothetical protein VFB45_01850 [Pseudolabrys sp.]|nr:hypothetical protein [Pseudolabrys sp.]
MACVTLALAGAAVLTSGIGVGLHAERAPLRVQPAAAPATASLYDVDRTHKGDRLKMLGASRDSRGQGPVAPNPARSSDVPVGCDPAFSPLSSSARASNFASRCLADLGRTGERRVALAVAPR